MVVIGRSAAIGIIAFYSKGGKALADFNAETDSRGRAVRSSLGKISVNYLCVPFAEHFEQPVSVVHCVNGVSLIRRFDGIFKPVGDTWICKDFFESHTLCCFVRFWI